MIVSMGHSEYGNLFKLSTFTIFDILKKSFLKVEERTIGLIETDFRLVTDFQTS